MNTVFQPTHSKIYFNYLIFTHVFLVLCLYSVLPMILFFFMLPCIFISCLYYLFKKEERFFLQHHKKTEWILHNAHTRTTNHATLLGSSILFSHLFILHFKYQENAAQKTIILFSDSFSPDTFRALRRCIRAGYL